MPDDGLRLAHVKRFYRVDKTGHRDEASWIDVMRLDRIPIVLAGRPQGVVGQVINYKAQWNDGWREQDDNTGNAARKIKWIEIDLSGVGPKEAGQKEGSETVKLDVIEKMVFVADGDRNGPNGQAVKHTFWNDPAHDTDRKGKVIKVTANDLGGDDPKTGGLDMSKGPVDWKDYRKALDKGLADKDSAINVEVIKRYILVRDPSEQNDGTMGWDDQTEPLGNQDIIELFDKGDPDKAYRLDPWQIIVNFSGGLAVEFGDKAGPPVDT